MTACNVLIVEDEIADFTLLRRAFGKSSQEVDVEIMEDGHDVVAALIPYGSEAKASAPPARPNFIVLDLKLRRMDGHEVLRDLKKHAATCRIPVIVFSSSSDPADVQRAYDLGANSYIVKPVRSADLNQIADAMIVYWCGYNCMKGAYNDR